MKKTLHTINMFHYTKTKLAASVVLGCLLSCSTPKKIVYDGHGSLQTCVTDLKHFVNSIVPSGCSNTNPTGNTVKMISGKKLDHVYGAFRADDTNVKNNKVIFKAGEVKKVYGGLSYKGSASKNSVTISGGKIKDGAIGGYSYYGDISDNSITISGGIVNGSVQGSNSFGGDASNNSVIITGGKIGAINGSIHGGHSFEGDASNNSITINGGKVYCHKYGGNSLKGNANNNKITISSGIIGDNTGGHAGLGNANNNSVTISGGRFGENNYGGFSVYGNAINNTITIKKGKRGNPTFHKYADLYGGYDRDPSSVNDVKTGNTLNLHTTGIKVRNIFNFENLRFYVQKNTPKNAIFLTLTDSYKTTDIKATKISVVVEGKSTKLKVGDTVTLIKTKGKLLTDSNKLPNIIVGKHKDSATKYNFAIEKVDEHTLVAKVTKVNVVK